MYSLLVAWLLHFMNLVSAIPTWEGTRQTTISSLVGPSATYIEAIVAGRPSEQYRTRHLSLNYPGQPGNLTVLPNSRAPPLFYIHRNQLWQFNNETSIYPVNTLNTTSTDSFPLQLVVGKKRSGDQNGLWRWRGTMLYYDQGAMGNSGLYYDCSMEGGSRGVFMFLQPSPTPTGCETFTLHTWSRSNVNPYKE